MIGVFTFGCSFSGSTPPTNTDIDAALAPIDGGTDAPDATTPDAGPADLVSRGIVVRYFIDEASSGQGPTELIDSSGVEPAQPLTLDNFGTANPRYATDGIHRGIAWDAVDVQGEADTNTMDSNRLRTNINNTRELTVELVVRITASSGNNNGSVVLAVGPGDNFVLFAKSSDSLSLTFEGSEQGNWDADLSAERAVVHLVWNTTEPAAADRAGLYINGTLVQNDATPGVSLDEQIGFQNMEPFVLGNSNDGSNSFMGGLFYAAIYNVALDPAELISNAVSLTISDDRPPSSSGSRHAN